MVPGPTDGAAAMVGGVALKAYEAAGVDVMAMLRAPAPVGRAVMALDWPLVPPVVTTCRRTTWSTPLVRPVMTSGLAMDAGLRTVHVAPLSVE